MDFEPVRRKACPPSIGPLDRGDGVAVQEVVETGVFELGSGQPVQIGVNKAEPSPIFVDQGKGRAADRCRFGEQPFSDASHQGGLTCPQFSKEGHHLASLEKFAKAPSQAMRLSPRSQPDGPRLADGRCFHKPLPSRGR